MAKLVNYCFLYCVSCLCLANSIPVIVKVKRESINDISVKNDAPNNGKSSQAHINDESKNKKYCQGKSPCGWFILKNNYANSNYGITDSSQGDFMPNSSCMCPPELECLLSNTKILSSNAIQYQCQPKSNINSESYENDDDSTYPR